MKRFAVIAALLMLGMTLPVALGSHLSTGSLTTAGMGNSPDEGPGDRTVPGTVVGADDTPYGVGTSTDCYDARAEVSQDQVIGAVTAREVCGKLVYNEGNPKHERTSPPDQDIPSGSPIAAFDVQIGYSQAGGFLWRNCLPFCANPTVGGTTIPVGDVTWEAVHTAGSTAGLMKGPDESNQEDGGRWQIITQDVTTPNAFTTVQRSTGLWEMNGWNGPPPAMERVVAFIEKKDGTVFTKDDLKRFEGSSDLSSDTRLKVCGLTPDADPDSSQAQTDLCEVRLRFQAPGDDGAADTTFDGYGDKCNSPTYVCAAEGPYWRSNNVGLLGFFGGQLSQTEVYRWHWVVAPNLYEECVNAAPNRLDFNGDGASMPYLAHDLDIYTTASDLSPGPEASVDGPTDYANQFTRETPEVPALPLEVQDLVDQADEAIQPVAKDDTLEPNNGDPVPGLPDNSRRALVEDRLSNPTACQQIIDSETDQTRDPWVNILDARAEGTHDDASGGSVGVSVLGQGASVNLPDGIEFYGSPDDAQDASNRPGPNLYTTEGEVGVFTDKNDDGDYDQVSPGTGVYQADAIQSTGAYPMLWDMKVEEGTEDNPRNSGGGCPTGPGGSFSSTMDEVGYGPSTALVQAIYLREPTVFVNTDANTNSQNVETAPFPAGNNIYVLANNAARELWDKDANPSNEVDDKVDALVNDLRNYVVNEHDADPASLDVFEPGEELGKGSDFLSQCSTATGGFSSDISFLHYCQGQGPVSCEGDTVATMYTFQVEGSQDHPNTLGAEVVPPLTINGEVHQFGIGQHTWYDVDPLDNDPTRNEQQKSAPPTGN